MKKRMLFFACTLLIFASGCKSKGDKKKEDFFPVLSYIKSQVAHVDTSLYQIVKLSSRDSTWDTTYIKREEFRGYAKDFLDLPDLTEKKYSDDYEESKFFDATLNRVIITYAPKNKESEIQREEVTIEPGTDGNDKVKNIIVDRIISTKDSTVTKRMLWMVDESFQVTSIIQKPGQPDSSGTLKVNWN